jgi:hypothetical protein
MTMWILWNLDGILGYLVWYSLNGQPNNFIRTTPKFLNLTNFFSPTVPETTGQCDVSELALKTENHTEIAKLFGICFGQTLVSCARRCQESLELPQNQGTKWNHGQLWDFRCILTSIGGVPDKADAKIVWCTLAMTSSEMASVKELFGVDRFGDNGASQQEIMLSIYLSTYLSNQSI